MAGQYNVKRDFRYYRCNRYAYQGEDKCRATVGADDVDKYVWSIVEDALRNPERIAAAVEEQRRSAQAEQSDIDNQRQFFEGQIAQCEKELRKWEQAYLADAIDVQDLKAKKTEVMARRAHLEQEITSLEEQQRLLAQVELETAALAEYCQRVREELQTHDHAEKLRVLEYINLRVIWHPDRPLDQSLEIYGSIPLDIASNAPCCRPRRAHGRYRRY